MPRIYNRIVDAVKAKFAAESGVKKCLAEGALETKFKSAKESGALNHGLYDKAVFSKVREGFGGKLRVMVTASAPLSLDNQAYLKAMMCCPLLEGYGQTENTGGGIMADPSDFTTGALGRISVPLFK